MKKKSVKTVIERAAEVPVTQRMLYGVRDELRSDIRSLEFKMESKFSGNESRFSALDSKLEKMSSDVHQIKILVEEQNAKNNIVLDGLASLFQRQERVEDEVNDVRKTLNTLRRP